MSRRPPYESRPDETTRPPIVEWSLAWLMLLAAVAMMVGGLANLTPG